MASVAAPEWMTNTNTLILLAVLLVLACSGETVASFVVREEKLWMFAASTKEPRAAAPRAPAPADAKRAFSALAEIPLHVTPRYMGRGPKSTASGFWELTVPMFGTVGTRRHSSVRLRL